MSETDFTRDELYQLATEAEIEGRSSMSKDELREALQEEAPHLLAPFQVVSDLEPGDTVSMNHLSGDLNVTEIRFWDGENSEVTQLDQDGETTNEFPEREFTSHTEVVMETNRGGRHSLVCHKADDDGPVPWKNDDEPHLRRWRAGDQEWMNNSTDPLFIRKVTDE